MKKKLIALFFLLLIGVVANAQQADYKSEANYLPQAGDLGLGLDASPFLNYIGNLFNGTENNSMNFSDNNIFLKYFVSDEGALRVSFNISGVNKIVRNEYVDDDNALMNNPLSQSQVIDRRIETLSNYTVRAGYQHFIGINRLRGFVGADAGYSSARSMYNYEYGNLMTQANPRPTTSNFSGGMYNPAERETERLIQNRKTVLGSVFTGAEYYFIPMLSLGLEVGLQYGHTFVGQLHRQYDTFIGNEIITMDETHRAKSRSRFMQSHAPFYGFLTVNFHF